MTPQDLEQQIETIRLKATAAQHRAADPDRSVWVSANAGTGKTRVLTDRILRLLVNGAQVTDILAVTYTRAAAQEMRNRVFETLAEWAVITGTALDEAIRKTGIDRPSQQQRDRARQLFATLLDQPVGLRIETVHAFSQSVLRRFPVEAGIQPYFELASETQAAMLKKETATGLLRSTDPLLVEALAAVALRHGVDQMLDYVARFRGWPDMLARFRQNPAAVKKRLFESLGWNDAADDPAAARQQRLAAAFALDEPRRQALQAVAQAIREHGTATEQNKVDAIGVLLDDDLKIDSRRLDIAARAFLTAAGEPFAKPLTRNVVAAMPEGIAIMQGEAEHLQRVFAEQHALDTAVQSFHLIVIAEAMSRGYAEAKQRAGLMDYDDLIETTRALLQADGGAAWVRYKLDRGINHLLIDEAQDTSPRQWQILTALAAEFFTGDDEDAADRLSRSLFSVGDYKQSIYSFQGAEPALFDQQENAFRDLANTARKPFSRVDLATSFRSSAPVLDLVNRVTGQTDDEGGAALPGLGEAPPPPHEVIRLGQSGFVDVMDVVAQADLDQQTPEGEESPDARDALVDQIVRVIKSWIGRRPLPARGRMMRAGDILILVRDRQKGGLYHGLDRELRRAGLPVAGADRITLNEDIAVRDLLALGRAVLLPEDDLTLATVLKSPLFGLTEEALFRLAHDRGETRLVQRLAGLADHDPVMAAAHEGFTRFLGLAESRSVHGFYSTVLDSRNRQAFARRMGNHVSDVLAEFLEAARQFEMINPSSLLGFIEDFETSDAEIRRESETRARDEIRIMTIHGAKGLEAPVVILPDALRKDPKPETVIPFGDLPVLRLPGRCISPALIAAREAAASLQRQEEDRLFYVAMTRAEDGLLVAGFEASRRRRREASQYAAIEAAITAADPDKGVVPAVRL
ncbi:MAG: UvrD-helicase domain-containing protein, partial [Candidatus Puniceispirillales bacterium]